jgi:hypothetical protein
MPASTALVVQEPSTGKPTGLGLVTAPNYNVSIRYLRASQAALDVDSLNENAYGICLVHYAFVSWMQLAALKLQWSALAKGSLVFFGSVILSWGTASLLRHIPQAFRRYA